MGSRVQVFEEELFPYLCTTIEGGQMGFALFILLFGQDNLYHLALLDLGNALILFPVIVTRMKLRAQGVQVSGRESFSGHTHQYCDPFRHHHKCNGTRQSHSDFRFRLRAQFGSLFSRRTGEHVDSSGCRLRTVVQADPVAGDAPHDRPARTDHGSIRGSGLPHCPRFVPG